MNKQKATKKCSSVDFTAFTDVRERLLNAKSQVLDEVGTEGYKSATFGEYGDYYVSISETGYTMTHYAEYAKVSVFADTIELAGSFSLCNKLLDMMLDTKNIVKHFNA